ncbi:MAG TPA: SRPBCC family protein [Chloroflexota bacterium]
MIDVHERFEVASEPAAVWAIISDPHAVVGCVPGASLGEQRDDSSFDAGLAVKFGPAKVMFRAQVALELDHAAMAGHVTARGKDSVGGTRIRSDVTFRVAPVEAGSQVRIDGQVEISGKLASMIETGAGVVVGRMSQEFAENLARKIGGVAA